MVCGVMCNVTDPVEGMHAMTKQQIRPEPIDVKALLARDGDYLRTIVEAIVEATLEAEMTAALS